MGITERKIVSVMKACEILGVSRRTVYNWMHKGKVEFCRTPGGSPRIFADSLFREAGEKIRKDIITNNLPNARGK